jgi:hypothetical protein
LSIKFVHHPQRRKKNRKKRSIQTILMDIIEIKQC